MTLIALALVLVVFAGSIYGIWLSHETRQADQRRQRERWQRIAQANSESKPWNGPPKGPKGFDRNRRNAA